MTIAQLLQRADDEARAHFGDPPRALDLHPVEWNGYVIARVGDSWERWSAAVLMGDRATWKGEKLCQRYQNEVDAWLAVPR